MMKAKGWVAHNAVMEYLDGVFLNREHLRTRMEKLVRTSHIWVPGRYPGYEVEVGPSGHTYRIKRSD
jgi:hypothetical protein